MVTRHPRAYRPTPQKDLATFYHLVLYCPTKHTLLQEIKYVSFASWPGLTEEPVSKYLPESDITAKLHLDQQNQRPAAEANANVTPLSTKARENTSEVLLQIFDPTEKKFSDLTGKFPVQSDRVNIYILVAYQYDANNILTTPIKNRTGPFILNDITKIHNKLRKQELTPKIHIMYNEVSEELKQYFEDSDIQFQLVTPHMHQINTTERYVRTF